MTYNLERREYNNSTASSLLRRTSHNLFLSTTNGLTLFGPFNKTQPTPPPPNPHTLSLPLIFLSPPGPALHSPVTSPTHAGGDRQLVGGAAGRRAPAEGGAQDEGRQQVARPCVGRGPAVGRGGRTRGGWTRGGLLLGRAEQEGGRDARPALARWGTSGRQVSTRAWLTGARSSSLAGTRSSSRGPALLAAAAAAAAVHRAWVGTSTPGQPCPSCLHGTAIL